MEHIKKKSNVPYQTRTSTWKIIYNLLEQDSTFFLIAFLRMYESENKKEEDICFLD